MNFLKQVSLGAHSLKLPTYGARLRPYRDWFGMLVLLGLLLLAGTGLGAYTFVSVQRGEVIGTARPPVMQTLSNVSIQAVGELFTKRAGIADKYKNGTYTFIDPSR